MRCPYCGCTSDKVIVSRSMANGESVRRRRECLSCGSRFTSYEHIEEKPLMVVKRDGKRQPYNREKLEAGLQRAMEKRPISSMDIETILNEIEDKVIRRGRLSREIAASEIGEFALETLYKIDKVAYIRFASVYKHFESLEEFITEIKNAETKNCVE